ncbi:beta-1 3-glucan biosynthesis protein [Massilia sp. CCM 8733]|uniref:Beta-1 3-glucan biosynthesis protein n=1 Tax=Massilia mucilaginosa TaxID=2609282 RepID=A0ABX0NVE9_9BURK|nr:SMI1/KNR4 family protein [Massilia mucilaginosa]NHZ90832.1 beta-1 3-glucan biosynthesis protein [Massilia mucilaginosa]
MNDLLERLQSCIESRFPSMAASLNPGASQAAIDAFERAIGRPLPPSLRALYSWHDGQADCADQIALGLFFGLPFLPLDATLAHWNSETAGQAGDDVSSYTCLPPLTIRPRAASKAWIPLADDAGGAYLGIDLDPDTAGSVGQVISFGGREFVRVQAGASLEQFLERLLGLYANGEYALVEEDEGDFSLSTVNPETRHFLDYLRLKAAGAR